MSSQGVAMKATGFRAIVAVLAVALMVVPVAASGEEGVTILGMAWTQKPQPALVVSASGPLAYKRLAAEPGVVALFFPGAAPAARVAPVAAEAEGLLRAELAGGQEETGGSLLRVTAAPGFEAVVEALPAGVEVRLVAAGRAAARPGATVDLDDLLAVADDRGVSVLLAGSGPLAGKVFTLPDPDRIVVDLPGVVSRVSRRMHPVDASGVRRVRVSQNQVQPDAVVRIVVDLERPLPYAFESTPRGGVLRVGEPTPPAAASAPQEAEPVVVAVAEPVPPTPIPAEQALTAPPGELGEAAPAEAVSAPAVMTAAAPAPTRPARPPVAITDAPLPTSQAQEAAAPASPPAQPSLEVARVAAAEGGLTDPPLPTRGEGTPARSARPEPRSESPWTTSRAALVESSPPVDSPAGSITEVESQERRFTGEPLSLELKDADVKDVLKTFASVTGLNIVVDPEVSGSVTVNLTNVPWDQALDIILKINGLDYVVENNVLRVARITKLMQEKRAIADFKREEERAKPMRTVTKVLSYAKASTVAQLLQQKRFLLSEVGEVVVDERTNTMIIRDIVDRVDGLLALIDSLDTPVPQVMIEARIVETTRDFSRALGVTWGFSALGDARHGTTTGWRFPHSYDFRGGVDLAKPGNAIISLGFADILDAFNLDFALQAAEANNLVKIVSTPKVQAQNNQKANIQSGVQLPVQTVANNTVTVQYVNATLSLDVTPQITAEGTVILDIILQKREPLPGANLQGGQNVPILTRDAQTRLLVRDGGTTVIGGIYKFQDNDGQSGVPGLSKLPVLGSLFRNRDVRRIHEELLIFITPRIVKY